MKTLKKNEEPFNHLLGKKVKVRFVDGEITGILNDYTTSQDNDDNGEYYGINPESGPLKGMSITFYPKEVDSIEVLD